MPFMWAQEMLVRDLGLECRYQCYLAQSARGNFCKSGNRKFPEWALASPSYTCGAFGPHTTLKDFFSKEAFKL